LKLAARHSNILVVDLLRNYGQHAAIFAGIAHSTATYVVTMDDDGQHPPESVLSLLNAMEEDIDVVYGVAIKEEHSIFRNFSSRVVKSLIFKLLGIQNAKKISAFRLIRSEILKPYNFSELTTGVIDVAINWNTERTVSVPVNFMKRQAGRSNYTLFKLISFAFNMIINYSTRPLKVATLSGVIGFFASSALSIVLLLKWAFGGITVPGFTTIALSVLIFGSVQLITLGVIGEYVGKIHEKSIGRPLFAVRKIYTLPR
jgi:glycosyltransferase involved in cell wall biosynthesis